MKIYNIRLGFATNSSSTHSFTFFKKATDNWPSGKSFGWSFFTAASPEAKLDYLAATLFQNLDQYSSGEVARKVTKMLLGVDLPIDGGGYSRWSVDHQSLLSLPQSWFGVTPDEQFLDHLRKFFETEDFVILGGNDNDENSHSLAEDSFILPIPTDSLNNWVCRWDPEYKYWSFFSRESGAKMRMRFEELREKGGLESRYDRSCLPDHIRKAFAPELVDLKITEVCSNDLPCKKYCYQSSGPKGKHCDLQTIEEVAKVFASLKIFEVALGGGDPMDHPEFLKILHLFRKYGVVPSFSTRKTEWILYEELRTKIFEQIGAVGFSVNSSEEIQEILTLLEENLGNLYPFSEKIKFHYVMGSTPLEELTKIVNLLTDRNCPLGTRNLLLLSFKNKGRGQSFKTFPYEDCIQMLLDHKVYHINADTVFLQEFRQEVEERCPKMFLEFEEGKFSCYIDPIRGTMAPSSFVKEDQKVPFDPREGAERFKEIFSKF